MDVKEIGWDLIGSGGRCYEPENEPYGFIKCWEFFDYLSNY
jgi:hypothetical protein